MKIVDSVNGISTGSNVSGGCYDDHVEGQVLVGVPPPGSQFRYEAKVFNPNGATVNVGGTCLIPGTCTETPPGTNLDPRFQSTREYDGPNGSPLGNNINLRGMSVSQPTYMRFLIDWTPADKKLRRLAYMNGNETDPPFDCPGFDAAPVKVECTASDSTGCTKWRITGTNACYFKQDKISGVTTWVLLGVVSVPAEILLGPPSSTCSLP